jgi:hypothetical protein
LPKSIGGTVGAAVAIGVGAVVIAGDAAGVELIAGTGVGLIAGAGVGLIAGAGCAKAGATPVKTNAAAAMTAKQEYFKIVSSYSSGNPCTHRLRSRSLFPLVTPKFRPQWGTAQMKRRPVFAGRRVLCL